MNTLFLIITDAAGDVVKVTTHADRRDAFTYVNQVALDRGRYHVVGEAADLPQSGGLLHALADHLGSRQAKRERSVIYNLLASRYQTKPHEVIAPPRVQQPPSAKENKMTDQPAAKAPARGAKATAGKPAKPAKAVKAKSTRGSGKPAGKVADFRPVKIGSARANILKLMDGKMTAEQIAAKVGGIDAAKVGAHAFCLARDCGIGYSRDAEGRLTALFPTGKTLADALKDPQLDAKRAPETAKAKAAKAKTAAKKKAAPAAAEQTAA